MIEFRQPEIGDADRLKEVLDEAQPVSCEYSVGNLLGWSRYYCAGIAEVEGCLVTKISNKNLYGFPQGRNWKAALEKIKKEEGKISFYGLISAECSKLNSVFDREYDFRPSRDSYDYVYRREELARLSGRKYHSKRNHVSYFDKNFDWSYEEITPESLGECIKLNEEWFEKRKDASDAGIETERMVLDFAFNNYKKLNFRGGLLKADGQTVAFTFGERLNDSTFVTHFEKADASVRGAYPMINMLFAQRSLSDFELINREDDAGSEGLRKAKLSYHPEFMVEKFTAVKL